MTYYAKLWTDIIGDEKLMRGARKGAKQLVLLPWLIAFAKKADDDGRLSVGGLPAEPDDIAAGIPGVTARQVGDALRSLQTISVLVADDDGALRFAKWAERSGLYTTDRGASRRQREPEESYVYYAVDGESVKIGVSRNPWARVSELKTARPGIRVAAVEHGDRDLEVARHEQFKACRGEREWFRLTPELASHIAECAAATKAATTTTSVATTDDRSSGRSSGRSIARTRSRDVDEDVDLDKNRDSDRDEDVDATAAATTATRESAIATKLTTAAGRTALTAIIARAPNKLAWVQEIAVALDGMHGPALTPEQLDEALRDYVGNGALERPNLKSFRNYLRVATNAPPASAAPTNGSGRGRYDGASFLDYRPKATDG